jgi:metal-dependent amidase/aminoacylase/carboxypeptidase family protein
MEGTVRCLHPDDRALMEGRIRRVVEDTASAFGATAELNWTAGLSGHGERHEDATAWAVEAARAVANEVDATSIPIMPSEDFLHAERPPGRLSVPRERGQRDVPPPEIQLQRRSHPVRMQLFRRDRRTPHARALTDPQETCHARQEPFRRMLPEITAWRRDIHEHPEILFDTHRTAGIVAEKLRNSAATRS